MRQYRVGELVGFEGIAAGSVNSNFALNAQSGRYFLRVYEEQGIDGARAESRLLAHLSAHGVATPPPVARVDGGYISYLAGKPAAVFPWRHGAMRCQAAVTPVDAARVGEALARVHLAGEGLELTSSRFSYPELVHRLERIASAEDRALAAEATPLRDKLHVWTARRDAMLPSGLVHGDLFRDNVLWTSGGSISALLDFESASRGVFAYDLMVTLLAWCVGDTLDAALARALVSGYTSVRTLSRAERMGLLAEGCLAALRFTITRITDYTMRRCAGPRVIKDWTRFAMRLALLEELGPAGLSAMLDL